MRKLIITAAAAALVCLAVPAVAMPAKVTTATFSDSEFLQSTTVVMDGGGISKDAITDGTVVEAIIMDGIAGITTVITNAQKGENRSNQFS